MERETETGSCAQCSAPLCPHSGKPEPEANPNTRSPSPDWPESASPHTGPSAAGVSQHGCLKPNSLILGERGLFFVCSSVLKSGCLIPCDLSFPWAEWVFGDGTDSGQGGEKYDPVSKTIQKMSFQLKRPVLLQMLKSAGLGATGPMMETTSF